MSFKSRCFDFGGSELKKRIKENPKAKYWSVSQNDNDKRCQCDQSS